MKPRERIKELKTSSSKTSSRCPLVVRVVTQAAEVKAFDGRLADQHYLGSTRPVGDFLRQVVERDGQPVAQLAWGSAALKLKDREAWIGWTLAQRASAHDTRRSRSQKTASTTSDGRRSTAASATSASAEQPHSPARKAQPLETAPFGVIGLETSFAVSLTALVATGRMPAERLISLYVDGPAAIAGIPPARDRPATGPRST